MPKTLDIRGFDPRRASERDFAAAHALVTRLRTETWPDEPPRSLEEIKQELTSIPPFVELSAWGVWQDGALVAQGSVVTLQIESNRHLAEANIEVLPEHRRRGIGSELLRRVQREAEARGRRLLIGMTDSFVPAGEAFMARLGGTPALALRTSKLETRGVDRALMRDWVTRAAERAKDFELELWEGAYPKDAYDAITALKRVMNTAPRDRLEVEDIEWTPAQLEQMEASLEARDIVRWTLVVRHRPSGRLAGYTEVFWNPRQPARLDQGDTGVFPEYRNLGLGRWLKAAMMEKILAERPQVERVYTTNAYSNAPMLGINEAMGFRAHKTHTNWQVGVAEVGAYLARKAGAGQV